MVRNLTRNMICFSAAIVLLALMLCAFEISLRCYRLKSGLANGSQITELEELISPSGTSWIDVKPLIDYLKPVVNSTHVRIQTNEHGLRAPSIAIPKPRGTYRVVCLGGDHVFGSEAASHETLPARLQRLLNMRASMPVEVINAGCPNAGPLINLLRYRNHLSTLQPDLVILCISEEDLSYDHSVRGALKLDSSGQPAYASHPALKGQGSAILDGICEEFVTVDWLLSWAGDLAGMRSGLEHQGTAPVRESIQRDLAAIVPLSSLVNGSHGNLVISVSPSAWSVDRARNAIDKSQSSFAEDVRRFLWDVHLEDQVAVQDGLTAFCVAPDARQFFSAQTGRLTLNGNELYAQQLAGFLLQSVAGLADPSTIMPANLPPPPTQQREFPPTQSRSPPASSVIR